MNLPDNLTPAELRELHMLQRALQDETLPSFAPDSESEGPEVGHPLPPTPADAVPYQLVNLTTGQGLWKGHAFTLPPTLLQRVLAIVAESIATDLQAEIERLRSEVS